jgi:DNA-binding GntR family transcriptional regulator
MTQATQPSREHGALRERVVDQLRDEIIDGTLAPGTPLRTEAVMERFGVSNSPLREAFAQLAAEGLIEVYRNRGAIVAPLTREGSADLLRVNALLWETVYRWAIPRLSGGELATVRRAAVDFELGFRSGDTTTAILDAARFEQLVLERCGSEELQRMIEGAAPKVRRVRRLLDPNGTLVPMAHVINETLAAAQNADPERAAEAVRALWADLGERLDQATIGFAS